MLSTNKLSPSDSIFCFNLIESNIEEKKNFKNLGWSLNQFRIQLSKDINFGLGLFYDNKLIGFVLGDLISIEKKTEYEILLIYINEVNRKLGYASYLLNKILVILKDKNLKKIHLEVVSNNTSAINLYIKNEYIKIGYRKKYYLIEGERINAYIFQKIINE